MQFSEHPRGGPYRDTDGVLPEGLGSALRESPAGGRSNLRIPRPDQAAYLQGMRRRWVFIPPAGTVKPKIWLLLSTTLFSN